MSADVALDTNILVYAYSADDAKRAVAAKLVEERCLLSVQALNEFANVLRRKHGREWSDIARFTRTVAEMSRVCDLTATSHWRALRIAEQTGYSFYDALMLAVALENGASVFLSEDLQHGRVVEGMEIRNPFS